MIRRTVMLSMIVLLMGLSGCQLIYGTAALGVGAVGLAGYTVYKGGEAVVSTVGSVGTSAKAAAQRKHNEVVISRGTLRAKCEHGVADLYLAAKTVFGETGFTDIVGRQDGLQGTISARTASNKPVLLNLYLLAEKRTTVEIRIEGGNLMQSEYIYDQILRTVAAAAGEGE
jgi:hypothetical protein